eukprot:65186-Pleurochrysis_carterae.AAC.1
MTSYALFVDALNDGSLSSADLNVDSVLLEVQHLAPGSVTPVVSFVALYRVCPCRVVISMYFQPVHCRSVAYATEICDLCHTPVRRAVRQWQGEARQVL